jgi:hypothetical protein
MHSVARTAKGILVGFGRGFAVFLLLVAFADMANAGSCCQDTCTEAASPAEVVMLGDEPTPSLYVSSSESQEPEHPASEDPGCDDCFCCAQRLLPQATSLGVEPQVQAPLEGPRHVFLPSGPPPTLYHPPRFA